MTSSTFTFSALALSALFAATPGATTPPQDRRNSDTHIDTTFAFDPSGEVTLSLPAGEIRVTGWARNQARVIAVTERGAISSSFSRNRLRLETRGRNTGRTRYEITVPFGVRVDASTGSGDINVAGTRSRVSLTTASGNITASDIKGRSEFESVSGTLNLQRLDGTTKVSALNGGVTISEITGDLEFERAVGPTRIERADLTGFRFESVSGDLDFDGVLSANGKHSIETFSGNVTLRVPGTFAATFALETFSGELRAPDFSLTLRPSGGEQRRNDDRREYTINGGGAHITIETFSGAVTVQKQGARRE
jgi:hypothetical protein